MKSFIEYVEESMGTGAMAGSGSDAPTNKVDGVDMPDKPMKKAPHKRKADDEDDEEYETDDEEE